MIYSKALLFAFCIYSLLSKSLSASPSRHLLQSSLLTEDDFDFIIDDIIGTIDVDDLDDPVGTTSKFKAWYLGGFASTTNIKSCLGDGNSIDYGSMVDEEIFAVKQGILASMAKQYQVTVENDLAAEKAAKTSFMTGIKAKIGDTRTNYNSEIDKANKDIKEQTDLIASLVQKNAGDVLMIQTAVTQREQDRANIAAISQALPALELQLKEQNEEKYLKEKEQAVCKSDCGGLQDKIDAAQKEMDEVLTLYAQAKADYADLQAQLAAFGNIDDLGTEYEEKIADRESLTAQKAGCGGCTTYDAELQQIEDRIAELEVIGAQYSQVSKAVTEKHDEIDYLKTQMGSLQHSINDMTAQLEKIGICDQCDDINQEMEDLLNVIIATQTQIAEGYKHMEESQKRIDAIEVTVKELMVSINSNNDLVEQLRVANIDSEETVIALQQKRASEIGQLRDIKDIQRDEHQATITSLKDCKGDIHSIKDALLQSSLLEFCGIQYVTDNIVSSMNDKACASYNN